MNRKTYSWLTALLLSSLFFFGCSKDDNPVGPANTPTEDDQSSAAEEFGPAMAGEDEGFMVLMQNPRGQSATPSEVKSEAESSISDTSYQRRGLTINLDWTYYSADSVAYESYDPNATVRIFHSMTVDGELSTPRRHAEIHQAGYVNVTGVAPSDTAMTLNGQGSRSVESTFQSNGRGVTKTFNGRFEWRIVGVVLHRDRLLYPYPLDGQVEVHATRFRTHDTPGRSVTVEVNVNYTVVFDGTQYAECHFPSGFRFWVDLTTGLGYSERP